LDTRITANTPVNIYPRTASVGYLTAHTETGKIVISSTGTEVGVIVDYAIFFDTNSFLDGYPYDGTLADTDLFIRSKAGVDSTIDWASMKADMAGSNRVPEGNYTINFPYIGTNIFAGGESNFNNETVTN
jgi:hypothetical protein